VFVGLMIFVFTGPGARSLMFLPLFWWRLDLLIKVLRW
jgi:hypothetical protein